ncbi:GtrA family protein [Candidatus Dependentiae bacterium]|nr:GtrA family protein [Candidatus Dependentiae bacterium]
MLYYSVNFIYSKKKIIKFLLVGFSSFVLNLAALYLFIYIFEKIHMIDRLADYLPIQQKDKFPADIANIVAIEISILFNYMLSRNWTWNHVEKHHGSLLLFQCLKFHLAILPGGILRIIIFPVLAHVAKINPTVNTMIGVTIAMVLNFLFYDKIVFTAKKKGKKIEL